MTHNSNLGHNKQNKIKKHMVSNHDTGPLSRCLKSKIFESMVYENIFPFPTFLEFPKKTSSEKMKKMMAPFFLQIMKRVVSKNTYARFQPSTPISINYKLRKRRKIRPINIIFPLFSFFLLTTFSFFTGSCRRVHHVTFC